jgi:hypothetical protein
MTFDRRSFLAATGAVLAQPCSALAAPVLASNAMRADIDLLVHAYRTLHPGLRRYLPAGSFEARAEALKRWSSRERTPGDFFVELARLTAAVRCGHSYPNPFNQSRAASERLFGGRDRIPFAFRWIDERMIVVRALAPGIDLPPGSEVLRIDGTPAHRLLALMRPLARADGGNDAKRSAQLAVDGLTRYAAFDVYRPLVAPTRTDGRVRVRARLPEGTERTVELPAMTETERRASAALFKEDGGWRITLADGLATLTMPTWSMYNSRWDWAGFIDTTVDRLIDEGARGLIIDLRGNEGGLACGDRLLERLITRDIPRPSYRPRTRYRRTPDDLRPALDTWDPSFKDWGSKAIGPDAQGFYDLARGDDEPLRARGRRFDGRVVALIGASNSSATFQFAELVKGNGTVTLVGETTGGNRRGINGGAYFFLRLPATGLEVDLPLIGYFPDGPRPDEGIEPDVFAAPTAASIARGDDPAMAAARRLLA